MPNSRVFITGAAGGIGLATARRFADAGWQVAVTDFSPQGVELAREQLHGDHFFRTVDVCDIDDLSQAMGEFSADNGGVIDVVVNNAGVLVDGALMNIELARQQALIDVNIKGFLNCAHSAYEFLARSERGVLVNLGSASSEYGVPDLATYSASKFFVRGLSEALSIEWQPAGIHVCEILPGLVRTNMTANAKTPVFADQNVNVTPEQVAKAIFDGTTTRNRTKVRVDTRKGLFNRWLLRHFPHKVQQSIMRKITRGQS